MVYQKIAIKAAGWSICCCCTFSLLTRAKKPGSYTINVVACACCCYWESIAPANTDTRK